MNLLVSSFFFYQVLGNPFPGESSEAEIQHGTNERRDYGELSEIQFQPWLVSIEVDDVHICAGSIINSSIILTAAHCVTDPIDNLSVRVGSSRAQSGGSKHEVLAIRSHENYTKYSRNAVNDLALLKISPALDENVKTIKLLSKGGVVAPFAIVNVAGWFPRSVYGTLPLRNASLHIVDCDIVYFRRGIMLKGHICTTVYGKEVCQGDFGGPIVENGVQVGIKSWDHVCISPQHPGNFASIAYYRDWIDTHAYELR